MPLELPGLERLLTVCRKHKLRLVEQPPRKNPLTAGTPIGGHPLDPLLASFYGRLGRAVFAPDLAGLALVRVDDTVNELESESSWWREKWQARLALPLLIFGGEPGLAHAYATVPGLADPQGRQPVVRVDTQDLDGPYALPVASDVDRLFETYSRYLEALLADPDHAEEGGAALTFPWDVPEIIGRDDRLVEMLRSGRFGPLGEDARVREWTTEVLRTAGPR